MCWLGGLVVNYKYTDVSLYDNTKLIDGSAILQRIHTILNTRVRERRMRPKFGSNLEDYLFEPTSRVNGNMLMTIVEAAVYQEPDVTIAAGSHVSILSNNTYLLTLNIYVKGLGQVVQYTQNFETKK